ncbi:MAG: FHA domain-containing protein [Verrucomicrobia bacterium]|nr:FHA domain-containing protein [Verrucomicrobiota bacterium]
MKIFTIGRKDADIVLTDQQQQVSRLHAELTIADDGSYYLTDCGSSNGTFIKRNNEWEPIRQEYVQSTDEIRFGGHHETTVRELVRQSEPALTMMRN